ncbi:MAG: LysR family transcriptional regulator [Pseudonocardiaceae bacterium]
MLDVRRLRLLRELSQHGTIAAAARVSSLTPSAVSQQLSLLQKEVGAPLFIRDGRRLILTEAARVLVTRTERVLAELEGARADVAELTSTVRGILRVAAFPTAAVSLVPGAIVRCHAAHPDLRILLAEYETDDGIVALKAGHVDIALVYEYSLLPRVRDPGVELIPLVTEPLLAALPPAMRAGAGAISLGSLADEPWIAPHSDAALRAVLERVCGIAGFEPRLDYTSDELRPIVGTRPSRHRVGRRARGRRAEPSGGLGGGCAARGRR